MNVAPARAFLYRRAAREERGAERGRTGERSRRQAAWSGLRYPGPAAGAGQKRRAAVKGRTAAKRSGVYP